MLKRSNQRLCRRLPLLPNQQLKQQRCKRLRRSSRRLCPRQNKSNRSWASEAEVEDESGPPDCFEKQKTHYMVLSVRSSSVKLARNLTLLFAVLSCSFLHFLHLRLFISPFASFHFFSYVTFSCPNAKKPHWHIDQTIIYKHLRA